MSVMNTAFPVAVAGAVLCLCAAAETPASAQGKRSNDMVVRHDANFRTVSPEPTTGLRWIDGRDLPLEGKAFAETGAYYDRLPAKAEGKVPAAVWDLQHCAAGLQFRFRTDATRLRFRWSLLFDTLSGDFLSATGRSGIDVYRRIGGRWCHVDSGRVRTKEDNILDIPWPAGGECLVNLPSYNGISRFELGVPEDTTVSPLEPRASGILEPVVFYGSSITQGGCATRPGNGFVNIAGRLADVPVVNFGFSGSGCMEDELCDLLCETTASCYVLDTAWNMDIGLIDSRWERFARKLHGRHPDVPMIFAEPCRIEPCKHDMVVRARHVRGIYEKLKREDPSLWGNLHLLPGEGQLPPDGEGTVDGIHPNDYGMQRMGQAFADIIVRALATSPRSGDANIPVRSRGGE